jgi:hypothetical protein
LAKQWTQEVLDPKNSRTWQDRRRAECAICATERRRRCIVAGASDFGPNPKDPLAFFSSQPDDLTPQAPPSEGGLDSMQISTGAPHLYRTAVRAIKSLDPSAYHIVGHSFLPVFDLYLNQLGSKQWLGFGMQLC